MKNAKTSTINTKGTLGRILRYVGRYPVALAGSLLFAIITVAATLVVPVWFGDAIDCIMENGVAWDMMKNIFIKVFAAVCVGAALFVLDVVMELVSDYREQKRKKQSVFVEKPTDGEAGEQKNG